MATPPSGPHDLPPVPLPVIPLTRMTWQDAVVVIAGLGFTAFLVMRGVSLETAIIVTLATVAALVMLVLSPREILEIVRVIRDYRRLSLGDKA